MPPQAALALGRALVLAALLLALPQLAALRPPRWLG